MKCELCKCLNLIIEGRKHPSQTVWNILNLKFQKILQKDHKSIESFCEQHRQPMQLNCDLQSVDGFIREVYDIVERYVLGATK